VALQVALIQGRDLTHRGGYQAMSRKINHGNTTRNVRTSMNKKIGWLHISDLHFLEKNDWRNNSVLQKLREDVDVLRKQGLGIDLVFCTGDIGFGETSKEPLTVQYAVAKDVFKQVLELCELPNERLFLVPGNHDIDRKKVLKSQTAYLRGSTLTPDLVNQMFTERDNEITRALERLEQYRQFVLGSYPHLAISDASGFGGVVSVNDLVISITGLNSAWTCADEKDIGALWLAGEAQMHECKKAIDTLLAGRTANLKIALIHHPISWLNPLEALQLRGHIQNEYDFLLHGHTHDAWVVETTKPYHIVIAAGAATAETDAEFGYNISQIQNHSANVHLRKYDRKGRGWVKEVIAGRAEDGVWPVQPPPTFLEQPKSSGDHAGMSAIKKPLDGEARSRGHFGVDEILPQCTSQLKRNPVLAICGLAGVGKTVIVDELRRTAAWSGLQQIQVVLQESTSLNDFYIQLAPQLGLHEDRPLRPVGKTHNEVANELRRIAPVVAPFFIHIQRGQHWIIKGKWRSPDIAPLLVGLTHAFPGSVIVLETRERPEMAEIGIFEAIGLPEPALIEYLAKPPGFESAGWALKKDDRRYVFQRLGGGHGRGAHAFGLVVLIQLAYAKSIAPDEMLRHYAEDYAEVLYLKLFRELYDAVLCDEERQLLFACSLYRNGLHYSHLNRLEQTMAAADFGAALIRRRLLTEDAEWLYLHDLVAEQACKLAADDAQTQRLHRCIADFWLADLKGQRLVIEANIRRALEAFYHLENAGDGERVVAIAPDLLGQRPDEACATLWRIEEQCIRNKKDDAARMVLEYVLKIDPDDHKAMRFLGEIRRKLYGNRDNDALGLFRRAVHLHPTFPHYWANYGHSSIAFGNQPVKTFLLEIEGASASVFNDTVAAIYATALAADGRGEEASTLRMNAINDGTTNAVFFADEAKWLLDHKNDPKGALAVLDKARELRCANDFTEAIYATALAADGRGEEASTLRMNAINDGTTNAVFFNDEAKWLLDHKNDPKGALAVLDKARERRCADDFTEAIYATALAADGCGEEASTLRMNAINDGATNAAFFNDEAKWLLDHKNDPKGALAVLDKARERRCADDFTEAIYATALAADGCGEEVSAQ
jgi:predicted phosphodiesterase